MIRPWWSLLRSMLTPLDGWVLAGSALAIGVGVVAPLFTPASAAQVAVNNQPVMRLDLRQAGEYPVAGRLGPVVVEVKEGRVRLLEYASPRMIGTRTGWVAHAGQVVACVPCAVVVQVVGEGTAAGGYDAVVQ